MLKFINVIFLFCLSLHATAQLEITKVLDSVYVYTTYRDYQGTPFPSNSMYIVTSEGIVMIDTPWDKKMMPVLLDSMQQKHNSKPVWCLSTHSHADRTAGVDYLDSIGVPTYCTAETKRLCIANKEEIPENLIAQDTTMEFGGCKLKIHYPGWGHTIDNIVVYLEDKKLLYGGCFVKSYEAKDLGYTGDASIPGWLENAIEVQKQFEFEHLITGHQAFDKPTSLKHTIKLLKRYQKAVRKSLKKINANF